MNKMAIDWKKHEQGSTNPFFKPEQVKGEKIWVKILGYRETELQFSGLSVIMDFEYKKEKQSIPLNKTNVKRLNELSNLNPESLIGQMLELKKVLVTNPKTKQEVESWRIGNVKPKTKTECIK